VQSRIERLERQRVIAGYTITVPDELEASLVRAHVMITLVPKQSAAIEVALRKIPEVRVLHSSAGRSTSSRSPPQPPSASWTRSSTASVRSMAWSARPRPSCSRRELSDDARCLEFSQNLKLAC